MGEILGLGSAILEPLCGQVGVQNMGTPLCWGVVCKCVCARLCEGFGFAFFPPQAKFQHLSVPVPVPVPTQCFCFPFAFLGFPLDWLCLALSSSTLTVLAPTPGPTPATTCVQAARLQSSGWRSNMTVGKSTSLLLQVSRTRASHELKQSVVQEALVVKLTRESSKFRSFKALCLGYDSTELRTLKCGVCTTLT